MRSRKLPVPAPGVTFNSIASPGRQYVPAATDADPLVSDTADGSKVAISDADVVVPMSTVQPRVPVASMISTRSTLPP